MSSNTNIALNSRSLNGVITISDGTATLENGDLDCNDINSNSLSTSTINTTLLNCLGKFECNSNGVYTIPILISTIKGLLISYGNTLNNGATDFTNFQSSYTSTKGGFNFWNKSSIQTLTNLAIIDNSQTYFKSQLIGCTAETPVNLTSIVNKSYVDNNFVDLTNQQVIAGNKIFNDTVTLLDDIRYRDVLSTIPVKELQTYLTGNILTYMPLFNLNIYNFITKSSLGVQKDALKITNTDMTTNCNFISNQQTTFNNFCPISNIAPTLSTHLTTKNYTDTTFVDIATTQTITANKTFTGNTTFNTVFMRTDTRWRDSVSPFTNHQQIYQAGLTFTFMPLFNLNIYNFITKNASAVQKTSLQITNTDITADCNFISNQQTTFNNFCPISNIAPTLPSHLITKNYTDTTFQLLSNMTNYVDITTNQSIAGDKIFNGTITSNSTVTLKNSNTFGTISNVDVQTFNSWVDLKFRTRVYDVSFPHTAHTQIYMIGNLNFIIYPIPNSGTIELYAKNSVGGEFNLFSFTALLNTCRVPLTCLAQTTFTVVPPLCSIAPTLNDHLCNKTYVDGLVAGSVSLSGLNTWTNTNTFNLDIIVKSSVYLNSISGGRQATFYLDTYGTLAISSDNASGIIQLNTQDALGNTYNRIIIDENEINTTVPISLTIDYTYYNPVNFGSNRLGYSTSNTGGTNVLITSIGNNSGQLSLPCGSWNITYTAIITVITGTLTSLESLHLFISDNFNANLNIIGLEVLNYYQISSIPNGKQIKISASGNIISYNNVNTQYNLRLISIFVAGSGGLTFNGKVSATRNA